MIGRDFHLAPADRSKQDVKRKSVFVIVILYFVIPSEAEESLFSKIMRR
jgi:hypothetical protein